MPNVNGIKIRNANFPNRITVSNSDKQNIVVKNDAPIYIGGDPYTGETEWTPKANDQIIPIQGYFAPHNLTVKKIPYYAVSNEQNGTTIIIGGD